MEADRGGRAVISTLPAARLLGLRVRITLGPGGHECLYHLTVSCYQVEAYMTGPIPRPEGC
jgi:hypothetical protein